MFSKSLLVFLVVCFVTDYSYAQKDKKFFRKDYEYIRETESFYKIHSQSGTWFDAKRLCALEGASLFYPEDEAEANIVISFWKSHYSFEYAYIGLSDLLIEGVFVTIDDRPIEDVYHKWNHGEPNNYDDEDCVTIKNDGTLNDIKCSIKYPFICKKSLKSLEWNVHCNIPNLDYKFNEQTGSCYKLHISPLKWTDALALCNTEQAYLTVVNSHIEAHYLVTLADAAPKDRITDNYLRGLFYLGYHNMLNEGWRSVRGHSLYEGNYPWWGNYQCSGATQQCGAMFFNGQLNDIDCNTRCFFICEHEVEWDHFSEETSSNLDSVTNAV